jgi:hypothetical protein
VKPSSAKAKGRSGQQAIVAAILARFPHLEPDDVQSRSMGAGGEDILLSPVARRSLPLSIESKNTERLNLWESLAQAEANAKTHIPAVVFKRNRSKLYITLPFESFLRCLPTP